MSNWITPFLWFDNMAEEAAKSQRVMAAVMRMIKIDIAQARQACEQD